MKTKIITVALLVLVTFGMLPISIEAQDDECPSNANCVEYQGHILDIDPECGVVQTIVVRETMTRIQTLEEDSEGFGLLGIVVAKQQDDWVILGEFFGPAEGTTEDIRFGDVGCVDWQD